MEKKYQFDNTSSFLVRKTSIGDDTIFIRTEDANNNGIEVGSILILDWNVSKRF